MDIFRAAPVETLGNDFIAPDMLAAQGFRGLQRRELARVDYLREEFETNFVRRRERDFVETLLRGIDDRLALLVEGRG